MTPVATRSYHVVLNAQGREGSVAKCLGLPGCLSEGRTEAEALRNIHDAIRLLLGEVAASLPL